MLIRAARAASVLMVSALTLLGSPTQAFATWSAPVPEGAVLLGYGATYAGCVHRGIDLRARAGEGVSSPVDGTVTFAGSVPADGGGTCTAVTIETADGLRVTLMPLCDPSIISGVAIRVGERVGLTASGGDSSTAEPHVHLSLRRGETYLDPTGLLPTLGVSPTAPEAPPAPVSDDVQAPPIATTATASSAAAAAPAAAVSTPSAQPVTDVLSAPVFTSPRSVRMPRDAQEARPVMLHSAPASSIGGLRIPSAAAVPSAVLAALVLAVMVTILAVRILPRHAFDPTSS